MSFPEKKFDEWFKNYKHVSYIGAARWGYEQARKEIESSNGFKSLLIQAEDYEKLKQKARDAKLRELLFQARFSLTRLSWPKLNKDSLSQIKNVNEKIGVALSLLRRRRG